MKFEYNIIRSKRKTIAISVDLTGKVTVRAPLYCSSKIIDDFIDSKKQWIESTVLKQKERAQSTKIYTDDEIENLRKKAKEIIPEKVAYFSKIMGVTPTGIKITSARTRYGSCSGKNSLNFSIYLMTKSDEFIDYVVVHELAHIKHHNHSKDFYDFVSCFMPNYKDVVKKNK